MKKLYLLLLMSVVVISTGWTQVKKTPSWYLSVPKFKAGIAPDTSDASKWWQSAAWADIPKYLVDSVGTGAGDTDAMVFGTNNDVPWIKVAWNDSCLFVLYYVGQDQFCNDICDGAGKGTNYEADRPEVYINANSQKLPTQRPCMAGAAYGLYQYTGYIPDYGNPVPDTSEFGQTWSPKQNPDPSAGYYYYNFHLDADKNDYWNQYIIPFTSMSDSTSTADVPVEVQPAIGVQIGFGVDVAQVDFPDDVVGKTINRHWAYWHGSGFWDNAKPTLLTGIPGLPVATLADTLSTGIANVTEVNKISYIQNLKQVTIIGVNNTPKEIDVYDLNGVRVISVCNTFTFSTAKLTQGLYIMRVDNNQSMKFVVR
jgi:hypothetical protein